MAKKRLFRDVICIILFVVTISGCEQNKDPKISEKINPGFSAPGKGVKTLLAVPAENTDAGNNPSQYMAVMVDHHLWKADSMEVILEPYDDNLFIKGKSNSGVEILFRFDAFLRPGRYNFPNSKVYVNYSSTKPRYDAYGRVTQGYLAITKNDICNNEQTVEGEFSFQPPFDIDLSLGKFRVNFKHDH